MTCCAPCVPACAPLGNACGCNSGNSTSLYDTVMADTVGVLWRAASGTVDPWTKAQITCCETQSLIKAGNSPQSAATQAASDATKTLTKTNADPSQFWCGIKTSASKAFCLTNNLGKSILLLGIGALLLIFALNYFERNG